MTIYRDFCARIELPVRISEVHDYILRKGVVDEISYFEVDADPEILRGQFQLIAPVPRPYCQPHRIARISFSRLLPPVEKRLVVVKELLHVFDDQHAEASTKEEVNQLIAEIVAPQTLTASVPTASDRLTEVLALAVLLPKAAVDAFRPAIGEGHISPEEVATIARIPERYGRFVFSPVWREILEQLASSSENQRAAE